MEIKKTKQANLENKKKSFFLFGLMTSLGFILMAFEWAAYDVNFELPPDQLGVLVENEPAVKIVDIIRPKPMRTVPKKTQNPIIDTFVVDNTVVVDSSTIINKKPIDLPISIDTSVKFGEPVKKPVIQTPFTVVEEMPSYVGGEEELFKFLGKNIKYTQFARESGIEGKVYIQFVVEKDGSITNAKIIRGLEQSLDNNALKTIKNMKKWQPGKQRGKGVRVQMVLPINYQLD